MAGKDLAKQVLLSSVFLVVAPSNILFLIKNTIPQCISYSILGTIVSPNKILLYWDPTRQVQPIRGAISSPVPISPWSENRTLHLRKDHEIS